MLLCLVAPLVVVALSPHGRCLDEALTVPELLQLLLSVLSRGVFFLEKDGIIDAALYASLRLIEDETVDSRVSAIWRREATVCKGVSLTYRTELVFTSIRGR